MGLCFLFHGPSYTHLESLEPRSDRFCCSPLPLTLRVVLLLYLFIFGQLLGAILLLLNGLQICPCSCLLFPALHTADSVLLVRNSTRRNFLCHWNRYRSLLPCAPVSVPPSYQLVSHMSAEPLAFCLRAPRRFAVCVWLDHYRKTLPASDLHTSEQP